VCTIARGLVYTKKGNNDQEIVLNEGLTASI